MKSVLVFLSVFIFFCSNAYTAEFAKGSEYKLLYAEGTVHLFCRGYYIDRYITTSRTFFCDGVYASPTTYSKFIHKGSLASKVKITNRSNKDYSKTEKFYSKNGESSNFNLLLRSIFQKPLLVEGNNDLFYELFLKDGSLENSGNFEVNVSSENIYCPYASMHSWRVEDCMEGGQGVCDRYFQESRCLRDR